MPLNSARAGLSPQEGDVSRRKEVDQGRWSVSARRGHEKVQEKKETKEGEKVVPRRKGSVCPQPRRFFFWFTSTWVLRDPSRVNIGSYETLSTRKPCAKEVPATDYLTQRKQYLKRTTLRTY
jgi:hypothetical protein